VCNRRFGNNLHLCPPVARSAVPANRFGADDGAPATALNAQAEWSSGPDVTMANWETDAKIDQTFLAVTTRPHIWPAASHRCNPCRCLSGVTIPSLDCLLWDCAGGPPRSVVPLSPQGRDIVRYWTLMSM
jgi:hypothetical protein